MVTPLVVAVSTLRPSGARGTAVVSLRVLDDADERDRAGGESRGDRVAHERMTLRHDPYAPQLLDRRLGVREAPAGRLGAEHRPTVHLPGDLVLVAADLGQPREDVCQRVARRPPENGSLRRRRDEQLALPIHLDGRDAVDEDDSGRLLRGGAGGCGDHAPGDRGGRHRLTVRGLRADGDERDKKSEENERGDETTHGGLRVGGKKRFVKARGLMDDRNDHSVPVRVSDGLPGRDVDTFLKGLCGSTSGRTAHHNGVAFSAF